MLDEGTPVPAAEPFIKRGHQVIHHRDVLLSGAKDKVVVTAAILNKAVLIAVDADMRRMVRRFGAPGQTERYDKLNLISIRCNEVLAAKRLTQAMSFIEQEWHFACEKPSRRMWVDIEPHRLITYRWRETLRPKVERYHHVVRARVATLEVVGSQWCGCRLGCVAEDGEGHA